MIQSTIKEIINSHDVSIIRFAGFKHNDINKAEIGFLKKLGFVFINKGINFVIKKLGNYELNHNSIFLSRLYTQGITY
jgi:hypothetical protein